MMSGKRDHPLRHAVVVVIDRLGAGFLGPYGNTWIETPAFNQLAAESLLIETAIADSPALSRLYTSFWDGSHALAAAASSEESLPQRARQAGMQTVLVTDDELLLSHPSNHFEKPVAVIEPEPDEPASCLEETHLARVFLAASDQLAHFDAPSLMWLHCGALDAVWDAPLEWRERFREEGDPAPYDDVLPPKMQLAPDYDPDELLRYMHAYAAEVAVADACLETFLAALDEHPASEQTLVIVTSPRGFPLGEHGWLGGESALFGEVLHVPLLLRHPQRLWAATRLQALVQPASIYATLADWLGWPTTPAVGWCTSLLQLAADAARLAPCAISVAENERSIRTPAWFLRLHSASHPLLFAKPDDRWEVNEVASRCGSIAQQLAETLAHYEQLARAGQLKGLPELPVELLERRD